MHKGKNIIVRFIHTGKVPGFTLNKLYNAEYSKIDKSNLEIKANDLFYNSTQPASYFQKYKSPFFKKGDILECISSNKKHRIKLGILYESAQHSIVYNSGLEVHEYVYLVQDEKLEYISKYPTYLFKKYVP